MDTHPGSEDPKKGDIVRVRTRNYLVEGVTVRQPPQPWTRVSLSCLDDDAQGAPLDVLWEVEVDAEVLRGSSWKEVARRGFDEPSTFAAYLHARRWNCVTSTDAGLFQAPYRAGIQVTTYQLEPLRRALQLPRVNLFIADDVGLGKTIEAGLILREMIQRQKVRRVVVACPPSVELQWRDELDERFGLSFVIHDRAFIIERRKERGYNVNPWSTHNRFIISHARLRDEEYAGPLRSWLDEDPHGTLLILDEAHNAAPSSGGSYAIDSRFTRTVRDLAPRFEHRLFLSATPHNGHSNSFAALLEILDPQRFTRGVQVRSKKEKAALEEVIVRRLKRDIARVAGGFPERKPHQIDIDHLPEDAPELALSRLLDRYRQLREQHTAGASRKAQAAAVLTIIGLQKRLLSSIDAFASTLAVHKNSRLKKASKELASAPEHLRLLVDAPDADDDEGQLSEEQLRREEEAQIDAATRMAEVGAIPAAELQLLDEMAQIAEPARHLPDPRVLHLIRWIKDNLVEDGKRWGQRRVLIFTEYAATKDYLQRKLSEAFVSLGDVEARIRTFHGGLDEDTREDIKRAFNQDPRTAPLRILIATDAAREGVNFQNHCADLFHFDIPWNPSRMEQRNGRIDRKLQRSPVVHCYYFVFLQRPEDHVLRVLVRRTLTIQQELGSQGKVIEARLASVLEGGIRHRDRDQLTQRLDQSEYNARLQEKLDEELDQHRAEQINDDLLELEKILAKSRDYLHLDEGALQSALRASLRLAGAPAPTDTTLPDGRAGWDLRAVAAHLAGDASWVETLDTLRPPRSRGVSLSEWRAHNPPRPVAFHPPRSLDDIAVHLHLEHRFVQRLLGRFLAQGFVYHDLARAVLVVSREPQRRVVLLGRLSLFGDRAARLHDQILAVVAPWEPLDLRKKPLRQDADLSSDAALRLVEDGLRDGARPHSPDVARLLASSVAADVEQLLPALHRQADGALKQAERALLRRGNAESEAMRKLLLAQLKRIQTMIDSSSQQQQLQFSDDERRQLKADQDHWRRRAREIEGQDGELSTEPARIVSAYETRASRVEPFGVVYLWPESLT
jgi:superfamily II DNA/RNA helicase